MITAQQIEEHATACRETLAKCGEGPWLKEPDRLNWKHAGLDCMLVRNFRMGNWCGYVGVPPTNPAYGKKYNDVEVEVHGGLTYARYCEDVICHVTDEAEDKTYWLGFDCAHYGDLVPHMAIFVPESSRFEQYKDIDYVKHETEQLAKQLSELK